MLWYPIQLQVMLHASSETFVPTNSGFSFGSNKNGLSGCGFNYNFLEILGFQAFTLALAPDPCLQITNLARVSTYNL